MSCGSEVEPVFCYWKVAGSIPQRGCGMLVGGSKTDGLCILCISDFGFIFQNFIVHL